MTLGAAVRSVGSGRTGTRMDGTYRAQVTVDFDEPPHAETARELSLGDLEITLTQVRKSAATPAVYLGGRTDRFAP